MNIYLRASIIITLIIVLDVALLAQDDYVSSVVFTLPWGNESGEISPDFNNDDPLYSDVLQPGPWAFSDSEVLVIVEQALDGHHIIKYSSCGLLIAWRHIENTGLDFPSEIAICNSGEVAFHDSSVPSKIVLLNTDLSTSYEISLPYTGRMRLYGLTPTASNSFWLAFRIISEANGEKCDNFYKTEIFLDGTFSEPEITWDDTTDTGIPAHYISPLGEPFLCDADIYGYTYNETDKYTGLRLNKSKLNEQGTEYELVYTHTNVSDPGWEMFDFIDQGERHFVTWSGDFYTIHATDAGMVLTKYTLQHE